jgi:bifunctional NMN adenylyltransferase/nudix hydrolase
MNSNEPARRTMAEAVNAAYPHDVVVYIGRFQPFHTGHLVLLLQALLLGVTVVVVLGSDSAERSLKNPLITAERAQQILSSLPAEYAQRVKFAAVPDFHDNSAWVAAVQDAVARAVPAAKKVALIGHFKDASSYYLNHFPDWQLESVERANELDATSVRNVMFDQTRTLADRHSTLQTMLPAGTLTFIQGWMTTPEFEVLAGEHSAQFTAA